jgi:hypothetical protein
MPGFTISEAPTGIYYTSDSYYNAQREQEVAPLLGAIFSLAGITKVGAKASFVFDSMFGFISTETSSVNSTFTGFDTRYVVSRGNERFFAMALMPSMRFQTRENSAFQITLTTISIKSKNFEGEFLPSGTITFPMPSCSWFFRF